MDGVPKFIPIQVNSTKDDLTWLRKTVNASAYPNAEIHLTEWSSSPSPRDCSHDALPAAAYIIKCNLDSMGLADSLSYWVFTDIFEEQGPAPEAFHGGFGLLNIQGIKKPAYHAYRFLNQLGEEMLCKGENYIITKNGKGKIRGLLYNYPGEAISAVPISPYPQRQTAKDFQGIGSSAEIALKMTGLSCGALFRVEILDEEHGNVIRGWESCGCPKNLTKEQETMLRCCGEELGSDMLKADNAGVLELDLTLRPWNVIMITEL